MFTVIVISHVIVSIALILIVLLQAGKGADMGAAFGGGASQTLFGTGGANTFLAKLTTVAAIIFMITSFSLSYIAGHRGSRSIMDEVKVEDSAPVEQAQKEGTKPSSPAPAEPVAGQSSEKK
ncbi:MAG: preprotein translocase subunit SecG [Pseudomonadota bacterium]